MHPGLTPAARATLLRAPAPDAAPDFTKRVRVNGKFLAVGDEKLTVRGVTYGTFGPHPDVNDGSEVPPDAVLDRDFAAMRAAGINAVRVYTVPPRRLFDAAQRHGLRVLAGLPWEQHVAFLDEPGRADDIVERVRAQIAAVAGHPALLAWAVGNEIPGPIVRWHGARRTERWLARLVQVVREADPQALVTYVNFPTTEYLQLPFVDFHCFNVYLEQPDRFDAYLARLQNLAGEKPLVMAEIGLDSSRNGVEKQAESLAWQVRGAYAAGCAGAFVFAWTDEWHRGGHEILDWDFGLVTRQRTPKPALAAVAAAFAESPFPAELRLPGQAPRSWPLISIVCCSYNGSRTIRDTLEGCRTLAYPNFEVIVVNDGSTDTTPAIAAEYPEVRLFSTENRGLSAARNTGWQEARGEIVAYIDDDAYPDPHWLHYLAWRFATGEGRENWAGVGGPNIAPPHDGPIADAVANAPGGPVQVLLTDTLAEHVPGCNMAFRRSALAAIGGFDVRYRAAGDDVDLCWRLQEQVGPIGFHAGAMDWHHRRNSLTMYWRQQKGYGKAEALLEEKWPERYNALGHLSWAGQLYGRGFTLPIPHPLPSGRARIYGGVWGSAAYQSLYQPGPAHWLALPLMPEWWYAAAALVGLSLLGLSWSPLLAFAPLALLAVAAPLVQAALAAARATFPLPARSRAEAWQRRVLVGWMHLQQPVARLIGRRQHGLTPWRRRGTAGRVAVSNAGAEPVAKTAQAAPVQLWSEQWHANEDYIAMLERALRDDGAVVLRGGVTDRFDLHLRGGLFGALRVRTAVEEHGAGKQLVRLAAWTCAPRPVAVLAWALGLLGLGAAAGGGWVAAGVLWAALALLAARVTSDQAHARSAWAAAVARVAAALLPGLQAGVAGPATAAAEAPAMAPTPSSTDPSSSSSSSPSPATLAPDAPAPPLARSAKEPVA